MKQSRWMLFVDGENLTIRGKAVLDAEGVQVNEGDFYQKNVFIWMPGRLGTDRSQMRQHSMNAPLQHQKGVPSEYLSELATRAYYYTCSEGDEARRVDIRTKLWKIAFSPEVFYKPKDRKGKAVDIALAKDFLSHAFYDNYDTAVLVAGDQDYLPLIQEGKRLGKNIWVWFF